MMEGKKIRGEAKQNDGVSVVPDSLDLTPLMIF